MSAFPKMAASKTAKILLIVGGVLIVLFVFMVVVIALLMGSMSRPSVAENSVLVLSVSGELPDYVPEDELAKAFGIGGQQSFTSLLTQLRKAKVDKRIGGILLDIKFPGIGWGKAKELRDAIADVRASGKPVYAYMEIGMNRDYYIATAADKIFLAPAGDLYINGFAAEAMFYKGSLDKLGIETEVIQIGPKYKNAPDQYTRKEMGEGQREVINAILDEYFKHFTAAIAEGRSRSIDDVAGIIDNAPYHAAQAKELGLVDDAITRDDVYKRFKERLGYGESEELKTIRGGAYREIPSDSLGLNNGDRVAVIFGTGPIMLGSSSDGTWGAQTVGSDTVVKAINDAASDSSIKAIVLRVDSPGGSALASDLMWHAVENAKSKGKPVVVSMADVAASGGYYISTNADKIVAEPTTITGSIGVFGLLPSFEGTLAKLGIGADGIKTTPLSGEPDLFNGPSPVADTIIQASVDSIYQRFLGIVAESRGKKPAQIDAVAQGRVWDGGTARQLGLVDGFGGLDEAIAKAGALAKIDDPQGQVRYLERPASFEEKLLDLLAEDTASDQPATDGFAALAPDASITDALVQLRSVLSGPRIQVRCLECPVSAPAPVTSADKSFFAAFRDWLF